MEITKKFIICDDLEEFNQAKKKYKAEFITASIHNNLNWFAEDGKQLVIRYSFDDKYSFHGFNFETSKHKFWNSFVE